MSTSSVNVELIPSSTIPILNFGAPFSFNPSNAFIILGNSNSSNVSRRIETAYEISPALANQIINSSVITGNSSSEISTDISNKNSVLQLISSSDLSTAETEVEIVEDFENNPCNSNIDQNASQTKILSTVTQNTEIHGVSDEGFSKRNEYLKNPDAPNPLIPVYVSSNQVKDLRLSAKLANLKSVLNPVQQVNATVKSMVRFAEDSSSKGDSISYQGVKDSNPRNKHLVVVKKLTGNPCNSIINQNESQTSSTGIQNTETHRVGHHCFPKHNGIHLNNPNTPNPLIPVAPNQDPCSIILSTKSANLRSILKPVRQVNATAKSLVRIAEDSSGKDNSSDVSCQGKKESDSSNQPVCVPEEVTKNFQLLKRYFVDNKCLICGFVSKRWRRGQRHMVVHMSVKPHQCQKCPKAFATESRLISHNLSHTNETNLLKFTCTTCGKCFKRLSYLKSHEDRHLKVVRHKCEICQKGFSRMEQLRRHARTHTGERPFVCNICGSGFASSSSFKKHTNARHTKEISYTCDVCQKVFYSANYFNVHIKAHAQGDVFQCDICDATFNFKSNLAQHKLTHSGNRSHKCDKCGKTFKFPHHLRQHSDTHKSDSASSKKRKTQSKRVKYDYSDDEDFDLPNEDYFLPDEDYLLPDVKDVKIFPLIKEED